LVEVDAFGCPVVTAAKGELGAHHLYARIAVDLGAALIERDAGLARRMRTGVAIDAGAALRIRVVRRATTTRTT
jgi:hypothetical protein